MLPRIDKHNLGAEQPPRWSSPPHRDPIALPSHSLSRTGTCSVRGNLQRRSCLGISWPQATLGTPWFGPQNFSDTDSSYTIMASGPLWIELRRDVSLAPPLIMAVRRGKRWPSFAPGASLTTVTFKRGKTCFTLAAASSLHNPDTGLPGPFIPPNSPCVTLSDKTSNRPSSRHAIPRQVHHSHRRIGRPVRA